MPLFAYVCNDCDQVSEILLRGSEKPRCLHCDSENLVKQMSHITPMQGGAAAPPACASCCPQAGACAMQGGGACSG